MAAGTGVGATSASGLPAAADLFGELGRVIVELVRELGHVRQAEEPATPNLLNG
ncbi:MAG TPA: hypothetical protein VIM33_05435 [Gaiellaceae bacterium]